MVDRELPQSHMSHRGAEEHPLGSMDDAPDESVVSEDYEERLATKQHPQSIEELKEAYREHRLDQQSEYEELGYDPFDPRSVMYEIAAFKKLEAVDPRYAPAERRERLHELVAEAKRWVPLQREGVGNLIETLRTTVEAHPDQSADQLMDIVNQRAAELRLSSLQLRTFRGSINEYTGRHAAVESYRKQYPNDADLYEACFGRKPQGQVEVVKGPMTLMFRCADPKDYAFAYFRKGTTPDAQELTDEQLRESNSTAGAALSNVNIYDLQNAVTIENLSRLLRYEVLKDVRMEEKVGPEGIRVDWRKTNITVTIPGEGEWEVSAVEHSDEYNTPKRLRMVRHGDDGPPVFDMERSDPAKGQAPWTLYDATDQQSQPISNRIFRLKAGDRSFGSVNIDVFGMKITNESGSDMTVVHYKDIATDATDEVASEEVRIHEDQHQFNTLFVPGEMHEPYWAAIESVHGSPDSPEIMKRLIHSLVRNERQVMDFDARARDELIAQFTGGRSADQAFVVMSTNKLYDYRKKFDEKIQKVPHEVTREIINNVCVETVKKHPPGHDPQEEVVDVSSREFDPEDIQTAVEEVFGPEYLHDLRHWCDAIKTLEEKGWQRTEIVSLLFQEPANSWQTLARRMQKRKSGDPQRDIVVWSH